MTGLADTVPAERHPKSCSRWFASDSTTGEAICDCGLAAETTNEGLIQHDLGIIMRALGVGDFARSESAHMVVHDVIVPAIRIYRDRDRAARGGEGLRAKAQEVVNGHRDDGESGACRECGQGFPCHAWLLAYEILHPLAASPTPEPGDGETPCPHPFVRLYRRNDHIVCDACGYSDDRLDAREPSDGGLREPDFLADQATWDALIEYVPDPERAHALLQRLYDAALASPTPEPGLDGLIEDGRKWQAAEAEGHVVTFTETGYGLMHPPSCRPDLIGCQLNEWLATQPGPDEEPGRYRMTWTDDGPEYVAIAEPRPTSGEAGNE